MHRRPPFTPDRLAHRPDGEREFISALARYQDAQGATDHAFAARLGVSVALWRQTRSGRMPLGLKLFGAGLPFIPSDAVNAGWAALVERARHRGDGQSEREVDPARVGA